MIEETQEHKKSYFSATNLLLLLGIIVIVLFSIYFRSTLLQYTGFYEPDGFYHFSVIRAAVNNNFIIPKTLSISGWPQASTVAEPDGLYWVTLLPYSILQYFGASYYTVMRLIPILFGLLDMVGAYYLIRYLSKDKMLGILAFLLVGFSMGDAARTSGAIYRGDGFVTIFLILALILLLESFRQQGRRKLYFAIASGFFLSICNLVWNGGPFAILIFLTIFLISSLYYFLAMDKEKLFQAGYVLVAMGVWFLFVSLFVALGFFGPTSLGGITFIYIFIALAVGWYAGYYILKNLHQLHLHNFNNVYYRIALVVAFAIIASIAVAVLEPSLLYNIFVNNGFTVTNSFEATIQELQPPTAGFLYASFGPTLYFTPMAIILLLSTYASGYATAFWVVMALFLLFYLFMHIERQQGEHGNTVSEKAKIKFSIDFPMIAMISYFLITSYLQINAVRFNSLISIPLAIFVAYTIFWLLLVFNQTKNKNKIIFYIGLFVLVILVLSTLGNIWATLSAMWSSAYPISILLAIFLVCTIVWALPIISKQDHEEKIILYVGFAILMLLLANLTYGDIGYSNGITQADNINPMFISALAWFGANSPANATVLTLWPDGSVVEGVANRTSVTDSVGAQIPQKALAFASWLFNSTPDPQFLTANISGSPGYLLVRYSWLYETSGIFTESDINASDANYYSYLPFDQISGYFNGSQTTFNFASSYSSITARATLTQNANGTQGVEAYAISGSSISPFSYVSFYNAQNGNYSIVQQTLFNQTNNQLFLIIYSEVPTPNGALNITGAYLLNTGMASSNLAKLVFFCNSNQCSWNNNMATLKLIYINSDTKIFKVIYNSTSGT